MITVRCQVCNKSGIVKNELAGQQTECPKCGAIIQIPKDATIVLNETDLPQPIAGERPPGPASKDIRGPENRGRTIPPPPRFYAVIKAMIQVGTILGILAAVGHFFVRMCFGSDLRSGDFTLLRLLVFLVEMIGVLTWTAVMWLLLDVALNIRIVRYHTRPEGERSAR
jgi:hypothetical protein